MALRNGPSGLQSLSSRLSNLFISSPSHAIAPLTQFRSMHSQPDTKRVPKPTPFVPDTKTFLTLLGRGLSRYASKLESWDDLFRMSSTQLRDEIGITAAKDRRYILRWRERFRKGIYGIGGDLENVVDGVADLKVIPVPASRFPSSISADLAAHSETKPSKRLPQHWAKPTLGKGMRYLIINPPPGTDVRMIDPETVPVKKYRWIRLINGHMIRAPWVKLTKPEEGFAHGMTAKLEVHEGMWEDKLGRKVDGGERKRAEVQAKRKAAERQAKLEAAGSEAA